MCMQLSSCVCELKSPLSHKGYSRQSAVWFCTPYQPYTPMSVTLPSVHHDQIQIFHRKTSPAREHLPALSAPCRQPGSRYITRTRHPVVRSVRGKGLRVNAVHSHVLLPLFGPRGRPNPDRHEDITVEKMLPAIQTTPLLLQQGGHWPVQVKESVCLPQPVSFFLPPGTVLLQHLQELLNGWHRVLVHWQLILHWLRVRVHFLQVHWVVQVLFLLLHRLPPLFLHCELRLVRAKPCGSCQIRCE
mmetsp:Transcript_8723/g.24962  ORF Transcript_8723/g.24962 Transcript_8723/m.24962 type:complete len:244 (-) Transcript_8723:731-1462(-)